MPLSCMLCPWKGKKEEATWHDLSRFNDDSMCSNRKDSGWWECPECGKVCRAHEDKEDEDAAE